MPDPVLQDTLDVTVKGDLYIFRIPNFADEIKLGLREREIRRNMEIELYGQTYPAAGLPTGDNSTEFLVRVAAQMEHLLSKGPQWVWSPGPAGAPVVDFTKWDNTKIDTVVEVGVAFSAALRRFRTDGSAAGQPAGGQAVARQPVAPEEPV